MYFWCFPMINTVFKRKTWNVFYVASIFGINLLVNAALLQKIKHLGVKSYFSYIWIQIATGMVSFICCMITNFQPWNVLRRLSSAEMIWRQEDQMLWRALHVHVQSFLNDAKMEVWAMHQIPKHRLCTSLKTRFNKTTRWVLYSCLL